MVSDLAKESMEMVTKDQQVENVLNRGTVVTVDNVEDYLD